MTDQPIVALAGAAGDLGGRIARALVARGATVRALVRPGLSEAERSRIAAPGVTLVAADPGDVAQMAGAIAGAGCVVSALNGLREVMIDRQGVLLDAALRAGVPRFVPSDYAADFTKTRAGDNRNFDLRRAFMARADAAAAGGAIRITSVLNGAFMDMLGREMPIIQPRIKRVLYWNDADQGLDFTTKDDVAAYVAAVAIGTDTPRLLRIAGDTISARGLAAAMSEVTGVPYRTLWVGSTAMLSGVIGIARRFAPQPDETFPVWQGMQYMRDQFSGRAQLTPLDSGRYPDLRWTDVRQMMAARMAEGVAVA
ncbi:MAG: NmrA family NAD(P)-binding protein [Candidatus Saccharibacteria bacterium]|nr:NmrA family NAD(P)-binding protein [Pseudorhodobacter sp.]